MKVSVDGLRKNMARAYSTAVDGYREAFCESNGYNNHVFDTLKEGLDDLRQMIGAFMCMYSDNPDDLMSNMTSEALQLPFADPDDDPDVEESTP